MSFLFKGEMRHFHFHSRIYVLYIHLRLCPETLKMELIGEFTRLESTLSGVCYAVHDQAGKS